MILIQKLHKDGVALIGANATIGAATSSTFLTYGDSRNNWVTNSHRNCVTIRLSFLKGGKFIKEIAVKVNVNERSVRRWRQAQRRPRKQSTR